MIHCEINVKLVFHEIPERKISQCILPFTVFNFRFMPNILRNSVHEFTSCFYPQCDVSGDD